MPRVALCLVLLLTVFVHETALANGCQDSCAGHGFCSTGDVCTCFNDPLRGYWNVSAVDDGACTACRSGAFGPSCVSMCPGGLCEPCSAHGTCNDGRQGNGSCSCYRDAGRGFWNGTACDVCADGYFGAKCDVECRCGSHGQCDITATAADRCVCDDGWAGATCAECAFGYFGPRCQRCPGYVATTITRFAGTVPVYDVCGGHGVCDDGLSGTGQCACIFPYVDIGTGSVCGFLCPTCGCFPPTCVRCRASTSSSVCSANGNCTFQGLCQCSSGFGGLLCETACPVNPATNATCSNRGTCINGECECSSSDDSGYWAGASCSECATGFSGAHCNVSCPSYNNTVCGGRGDCIDGECFCRTGAQGQFCGRSCELADSDCPTCPGNAAWGPNCSHPCNCTRGTCSSGVEGDGKCRCPNGFVGVQCETRCACATFTLNSAAASGTCSPDGTCHCEPGFGTAGCNVSCPHPAHDHSRRCGVHGICLDGSSRSATCDCNRSPMLGFWAGDACDRCAAGYTGRGCNIPCVHGTVTVPFGECTCNTHFGGVSCDRRCPSDTDSETCSSHGTCEDGVCKCVDPHEGPSCNCTVSLCRSVHSPVSVCEADGSCSCPTNRRGDGCTECELGYFGPSCLPCTCHDVTNSRAMRGTCNGRTGACTCFQNDAQGYWTGDGCDHCSTGFFGPDCRGREVSRNDLPTVFIDGPPLLATARINMARLVLDDAAGRTFAVGAMVAHFAAVDGAIVAGRSAWLMLVDVGVQPACAARTVSALDAAVWNSTRLRVAIVDCTKAGAWLVEVDATTLLNSVLISSIPVPVNFSEILDARTFAGVDTLTLVLREDDDTSMSLLLYSLSSPNASPPTRVPLPPLTAAPVLAASAGRLVVAVTTMRPWSRAAVCQLHLVDLVTGVLGTAIALGASPQCARIHASDAAASLVVLATRAAAPINKSSLLVVNVATQIQHEAVLDVSGDMDLTAVALSATAEAGFAAACSPTRAASFLADCRLVRFSVNPAGSALTATRTLRQGLLAEPVTAVAFAASSQIAMALLSPRAGSVAVQRFVAWEVLSLEPPVADAAGGTTVTVTGRGFVNRTLAVLCQFRRLSANFGVVSSKSVPATVASPSSLTCVAPPSRVVAEGVGCAPADSVGVSIDGGASYAFDDAVSIVRSPSPFPTAVSPDRVRFQNVTNLVVTVLGQQFSLSPVARCLFNGTATHETTPAVIVSPSAAECALPSSAESALGWSPDLHVQLSIDGITFSAGIPFAVVGVAAGIAFDRPFITVRSALAAHVPRFEVSVVDHAGNSLVGIVDEPAAVAVRSEPPYRVNFTALILRAAETAMNRSSSDAHTLTAADAAAIDALTIAEARAIQSRDLVSGTQLSSISGVASFTTVEMGSPAATVATAAEAQTHFAAHLSAGEWSGLRTPRAWTRWTPPNRSRDELLTTPSYAVLHASLTINGGTFTASAPLFVAVGDPARILVRVEPSVTVGEEGILRVPPAAEAVDEAGNAITFAGNPLIDKRMQASVVEEAPADASAYARVAQRPSPNVTLLIGVGATEFRGLRIYARHGFSYRVVIRLVDVPHVTPAVTNRSVVAQCPPARFPIPGEYGCRSCVSGATCNGTNININAGFWRSSMLSDDLLECSPSAACLGGTGEKSCASEYTGPVCSLCVSDHSKNVRGRCEACFSSGLNIALLVACLLGIAAVIAVFVLHTVQNADRMNDSAVAAQLFVSQTQTFAILVYLDIDWPSYFTSVVSWVDAFADFRLFDTSFGQCLLTQSGYSYPSKMGFQFLLGCLVFAAVAICRGIVYVSPGLLRREGAKDRVRPKLPVTHVRLLCTGLAVGVFFLYQGWAFYALRVLQCRTIQFGPGDTREVLDADVTVDCTSDSYRLSRSLAATAAAFVLGGVPIAYLALYAGHSYARPDATNERYQYAAFLAQGLTRSAWYWPAVAFMRKGALVAVAVYTRWPADGPVATWVLTAYLIPLLYLRPYHRQLHQRLEVFGTAAPIVAINIAAVINILRDPQWRITAEPPAGSEEIIAAIPPIILILQAVVVAGFVYAFTSSKMRTWLLVLLRLREPPPEVEDGFEELEKSLAAGDEFTHRPDDAIGMCLFAEAFPDRDDMHRVPHGKWSAQEPVDAAAALAATSRSGLPTVHVPPHLQSAFAKFDGAVMYLFVLCARYSCRGRLLRRVVICNNTSLYVCSSLGAVNRCVWITDIHEVKATEDGTVGIVVRGRGEYDLALDFDTPATARTFVNVLRTVSGALRSVAGRSSSKLKVSSVASVNVEKLALEKPPTWKFAMHPLSHRPDERTGRPGSPTAMGQSAFDADDLDELEMREMPSRMPKPESRNTIDRLLESPIPQPPQPATAVPTAAAGTRAATTHRHAVDDDPDFAIREWQAEPGDFEEDDLGVEAARVLDVSTRSQARGATSARGPAINLTTI